MSFRAKLGKAIRRLRQKQDLSQEAFADAVGVHRNYMGKVERGEVNISLDNIERISKSFGIPISQLMSEAERER